MSTSFSREICDADSNESVERALFPLQLTVFEEYMLLDDSIIYPMECVRRLRFSGRVDVALWRRALDLAVARHPLFASRVEKIGRNYYWIPSGQTAAFQAIRREEIAANADGTLDKKSFFTSDPTICLARETALRTTLVWDDDSADVVFQSHHSAADATGCEQLISDVLCEYAVLVGSLPNTFEFPPAQNLVLRKRGTFDLTLARYFRNYLYTTATTLRFLFAKPRPFLPKPTKNAAVAQVKKVNVFSDRPDKSDFSRPRRRDDLTTLTLDANETRRAFQMAKSAGVTFNDLLLAAFFSTVDAARKERGVAIRGMDRLAVPINLRNKSHLNASACNVVTMSFLDLPARFRRDASRLLRETHRRMQTIKKHDQKYFLGHTLNTGRFLARLVGGDLSLFLKSNCCRATATFSNVGRVFADLPLEKTADGRVKIGELVLESIEDAPPIRNKSILSVAASTYAGKLRLGLKFDPQYMTKDEGDAFLEEFRVACLERFASADEKNPNNR